MHKLIISEVSRSFWRNKINDIFIHKLFSSLHEDSIDNPSSRNYEDGYKTEYFYFDPYNIVYSRICLIKATTTVTEGLII